MPAARMASLASVTATLMLRAPCDPPLTSRGGRAGSSPNDTLALASRTLPNVLVLEAQQADPVSLVRFPKVIFTRGAVAKIEEMLA